MLDFNKHHDTVEMVFRNLDLLPFDNLMKMFGSEGASMVMSVCSAIVEDDICTKYNISHKEYVADFIYWNEKYSEDKEIERWREE